MAYNPTKPADTDLVKKSAELIRENFEELRKSGIVLAKPPLYGKGAPTASVGENGDRYIDVVTGNHYYKNFNGQWEPNLTLDDKYKTVKDVAVLEATMTAIEEKLQRIDLAVKSYCPYIVGEYKLMSHNDLSDGWVRGDGSLYNPQKYPKAFAIYGTKHGGDGVNTFAVPDWRGDAIRINDDGRGVDLGRILGSEQEDAMQNIIGTIGANVGTNSAVNAGTAAARWTGAFKLDSPSVENGPGSSWGESRTGKGTFDASRVVRTANETRMRNRSCCMYVYIGRPGLDA